ncbi:hypothetical protein GF389_02665 [Candidatus Dojkabacteria bacterium]|nr:hypothetical protein [Candidatus Dojkabacteria bacterium]
MTEEKLFNELFGNTAIGHPTVCVTPEELLEARRNGAPTTIWGKVIYNIISDLDTQAPDLLSPDTKEFLVNNALMIQDDTVSEVGILIDTLLEIPDSEMTEYIAFHLDQVLSDETDLKITPGREPIQINHNIDNEQVLRFLLFFSASNSFNRLDHIIDESAQTSTNENQTVHEMIHNTPVNWRTSTKATSPIYIHDAMKTITSAIPNRFPTSNLSTILSYVEEIEDGAIFGGELIKNQNLNMDSHKVYRQRTIGNYANLLSNIYTEDQGLHPAFRRKAMDAQRQDDIADVLEDYDIHNGKLRQPNPFVALLYQYKVIPMDARKDSPLQHVLKDTLNPNKIFNPFSIYSICLEAQSRTSGKEILREYCRDFEEASASYNPN